MTLTAPTFGEIFWMAMRVGAMKRVVALDVFAVLYMMIHPRHFMLMPKNREKGGQHTRESTEDCINSSYIYRLHDNCHNDCRHSYSILARVASDPA